MVVQNLVVRLEEGGGGGRKLIQANKDIIILLLYHDPKFSHQNYLDQYDNYVTHTSINTCGLK